MAISTKALFDAKLIPMLRNAARTSTVRRMYAAGIQPNQIGQLKRGDAVTLSFERAVNALMHLGVAVTVSIDGETVELVTVED